MFDFVFCCWYVLPFCQKAIFVMKFCIFFRNVNSFSILNILQNLCPIIRVSRYRPSIFKLTAKYLSKHGDALCNSQSDISAWLLCVRSCLTCHVTATPIDFFKGAIPLAGEWVLNFYTFRKRIENVTCLHVYIVVHKFKTRLFPVVAVCFTIKK